MSIVVPSSAVPLAKAEETPSPSVNTPTSTPVPYLHILKEQIRAVPTASTAKHVRIAVYCMLIHWIRDSSYFV